MRTNTLYKQKRIRANTHHGVITKRNRNPHEPSRQWTHCRYAFGLVNGRNRNVEIPPPPKKHENFVIGNVGIHFDLAIPTSIFFVRNRKSDISVFTLAGNILRALGLNGAEEVSQEAN